MADLIDFLPQLFGWLDLLALALFLAAWHGIGWRVEHSTARRPSVHRIMAEHRLRWMEAMLHRQPRIMDASLLNSLRSGCAFFASGCMIAIGGVAALLGKAEQVETVAHDLQIDATLSQAGWEAKLLVLALALVSAFMKFVWAHRLFGYCAILMGTVGDDPDDPDNRALAAKAAAINVNAGRNFNRGLRATYFSLALLTWLLGAVPLILATLATVLTLWRREFRSASRDALLADPPRPASE